MSNDAKKQPNNDKIRPLAALNGEKPPAPDWFDWAVHEPSMEQSVNVRGRKVAYSTWGETGRRGLLFVHGGRAHRNWWRPFAPFFAAERRVAAIDLPGMGDSDWHDEYSIELMVEAIFAVIEAAGLEERGRPLVVGHSFGGWATLASVDQAGDRLGGAVIVDSPLGAPDPDEGYTVSKARRERDRTSVHPLRVYKTMEEPIARFRFLPNQPSEHLYLVDYIARKGLGQHPLNEGKGDGWTWKFDPSPNSSFTIQFGPNILRAARCPLAFIYGEKSLFSQGDALQHLKDQAVGRSPFIMVPDAYHHLMMDQPIAFVSAMRSLLSCWPVRVGG